jgi:hypothetical protein
MMPVSKFACALVLAGGLTTPAFAQTNATPTPGSTGDQSNASGQSALSNDQSSDQNPIYNGNSNGQAAMHIGSALRAELTKAGYTDINIMPTSFMVRAKDSQGNPVMMVISPDSVTAIQQENADTHTANTATHNATGATPGATNP